MSTNMNRPFSLVDTALGMPVDLSVRVTVAAAITAPEESVTVPATVPVDALCENRAEGTKAHIQNKRAITNIDRLQDI
jgi:hypothetical protein